MKNADTVLFSHIDADGILSLRLAEMIWGGKPIFQKWWKFGVDDDDADIIASYTPKTVVVTDLGADEATLETLNKRFVEKGVPVWLIDNHPPEDVGLLVNYASDTFKIESKDTNCSAGHLYAAFKDRLESNKWAKVWTALAIYGDVKQDSKAGKPMFNNILDEVPILKSKILRWAKGSNDQYGTQANDMVATLSGFFQTPRRIARHHGAYTALKMCREIEESGDLTLPERVFGVTEQALYPATATIKRWKEDWHTRWTDVFKAGNIRYLDLGRFTFSEINHEWNLSTQVANVKANDTERKKPHFCLNRHVVDGFITLGARKPRDEAYVGVDIGKLLVRVTEMSGGRVKGGGLPMAASARMAGDVSSGEVITYLMAAFEEVV